MTDFDSMKALREAQQYFSGGGWEWADGTPYDNEALDKAIAAVAELVAADREIDVIEDEMRRAFLAGPRPNSYGTGWELRDKAAQKDRERRLEAAHARRAAALAPFGDAK